MAWLKIEDVAHDAREKIRVLTDFMSARATTTSTAFDSIDVMRAVDGMHRAIEEMRRDWFFASVGIADGPDEDDRETYYLSRSTHSAYFCSHDVVPWTNWIGSVYAAVMEARRKGAYPRRLVYGPPGRQSEHEVGPVATYDISFGTLSDTAWEFYSHDSILSGSTDTPPQGKPEGEFGLRDIVATIDVQQDRKIRSEMKGAFILTGGPGVGKTTVALHRLPFLINEQNASNQRGVSHYDSDAPMFFTPQTMAVVVWKNHLVPYLETCLRDLGLERIPVQHIDDWVAQTLRPHVQFGPGKGQLQLCEDRPFVAEAKLRCGEDSLKAFLSSEHSLLKEAQKRYTDIADDINAFLASTNEPRLKSIPPDTYTVNEIRASYDALISYVEQALAQTDLRLSSLSERDDWPRLEKARTQLSSLRQRAVTRLNQERSRVRASHVRLLMDFYRSTECRQTFSRGKDSKEYRTFLEGITLQEKDSTLSSADRYLLLWIIRILDEADTPDEDDTSVRLRTYSHIVVDEAQYYHPLLLRLLYSLTKEPRHSMTIVGDLEQRISSEGGLVTWDAAGISVPQENVQRLDTNYRWSRKVFGFLSCFRQAAGLSDSLREPDVWHSQEGVRPDVVECDSRQNEWHALAQRISQLKSGQDSKRWSMAIVLPYDERSSAVKELIDLFRRCDIQARWASGQDLRESKDHVVLTEYGSVVGLEFDAVFLPCLDEMLGHSSTDDGRRSLWVAVTRARRYEWVSALKGDERWTELFGQTVFDAYRTTSSDVLSQDLA